jgi:hypothetical protein
VSTKPSSSTALPIARAVLRVLIVVNWLWALAILALLFVIPNAKWIMSEFALSPSPEADHVILGLRLIAGIGLLTIPLNYLILKRLLAIIDTVRDGNPFVATNAARLKAIAWTLFTLQILGLVIESIARAIAVPGHPLHLHQGLSVNGWLAVLLTFLLAQVFAEGARMREDLEGMV